MEHVREAGVIQVRSEVTFLVDHGDTTDPFHQFIEEAERQGFEIPDCTVVNYTVKVDIDNVNNWTIPVILQELEDMGVDNLLVIPAMLDGDDAVRALYKRVIDEANALA